MKKNTWIALIAVLALAAIYYGTRLQNRSVGVKTLNLKTFAKDKIDKIEILGKEKTILEKKDNEWFVDIKLDGKEKKVLADSTYVDSLLEAALEIKPAYYVTELEEKLPELELSDDKKTSVKLYSKENILWELDLGKNTENGNRFIKLPNDKAIYAGHGSFFRLTRNGPEDFSNKNLIAMKDEDVVEFKLYNEDKIKLSIKRDEKGDFSLAEDQPNLSKDFRAKKSILENIVRSASTLRATGFKDSLELTKPNYEVFIKDKNGQVKKIFFYKADEEKYWAKKENDPQVFEVSIYAFGRINKFLEEVRDLTVLKIDDVNDIEKLNINSTSGLISFIKKDGKWLLENPKKDFAFNEELLIEKIASLENLNAKRLAIASKDAPKNPKWQGKPLIELIKKDGQIISLYATEIKGTHDHYLTTGNIDDKIYVISKHQIESFLKGLDGFKKSEEIAPQINEHSPGFQNLPPDVQKKLMDAMKNNK